jgi:hypothetical protein
MTVPSAVAWFGTSAGRVECAVLQAQIHHGRDDATSQPEASSATFELVGPLPPEAVIGARVAILAQLGATTYPRFAGEITDVRLEWDDVDTARPTIIAVGDLARLGRRPIGDAPWPQELDGARVSRVLTLGGFPPDPLLSDPGTVAVLARDVDRQPALKLAQDTAGDGAGIVWQDREGRIRYADALHRRGSQVALTLRSCDVGLGVGWSTSLEGLVNDLYLRYGPPIGGGDQAEVHVSDPASISARGTFGASTSTALATAVDAQKRADLAVSRQASPTWILGGIEVDLGILDAPTTTALLALEVHALVNLTGLPATSPAVSALLWVEGWRETVQGVEGGVAWMIALATSDYCRTSAPPRWDDLQPGVTWNTIDPARTWNSSTCVPPQPPHGRWNDAPSSVRWDAVDPATTWQTWPY